MANDPRYRSSRPDRLSQDRPSGDPLSELARLIGQDDTVAATARNSPSRRQRDQGDREDLPPRRGNPSSDEIHEDSRAGPDRHGRYEDADPRQPAYLAESPAPGLHEGDGYDPRGGNGSGYHGYEEDAGFRRGTETDDRGHYGDGEEAEAYDAPAYDDRYDEDSEAAGGYDNGPYYGEDGREELYALDADPDERVNAAVYADAREVLESFRGALRSMLLARGPGDGRTAGRLETTLRRE